MSLDKAIANKKEFRKIFSYSRKNSRAKNVSLQCRNNGSCSHCLRNRTISKLRLNQILEKDSE